MENINPLNIKYNMVQDSIEDEEALSDQQITNYNTILSTWKEYLSEEIDRIRLLDRNSDLSHFFKNSDFIQRVENIIIEFVNRLDSTEEKKNSLRILVPRIKTQILKLINIFIKLEILMNNPVLTSSIYRVILTKRGTINLLETAADILEQKNLLSLEEEYVIACYFCMESKVSSIVSNLPVEFINKFTTEFKINESYQLMSLWTFHAEGEMEEFANMITQLQVVPKESPIAYLLFWAIKRGNEVAVQYLWEHHGDENLITAESLASYALNFKSINIVCYFISRLSHDKQMEKLCLMQGYVLLEMLANDPRWCGYFLPVSNYILQFIDRMNFVSTLKTLIQCWMVNVSGRTSCIELINSFIKKFQVDFNKQVLESDNILNILFSLEHEKSMRKLLNVGNNVGIENIFNENTYDNDVMHEIGLELVFDKKTKLFDKFMRDNLNREEARQFKRRFFQKTNYKVFMNFLEYFQLESFDEYLVSFIEEDEIVQYKNNIPYKDKGKIIGEAFIVGNVGKESRENIINKIISWCFNGDEDKVDQCKRDIFDPDGDKYHCKMPLLTAVYELIINRNWIKLDEMLEFAFPHKLILHYSENVLNSKQNICKFKTIVNAMQTHHKLEIEMLLKNITRD